MIKKRIAILGSTGSIGTQTLDVISQHPDLFEVVLLTANNNSKLLIDQAIKFDVNTVVICNETHYNEVQKALDPHYIKVFAGINSVEDILSSYDNIDIVVAAMVGFSGLKPTMAAIRGGKTIALANKETLVAAGAIVTTEAIKHHCPILPVDSEHSAIFQCLQGNRSPIEKILLTASGGPFRTFSYEQLVGVTKAQALKHPNWNMGAKVTIDSSTMMNKGFEMIEARWLFNVDPKDIEIIVHPQSIIHSMVRYRDSSVIAQMNVPDMRVPIQYALSYPNRLNLDVPRIDFSQIGTFTFEKPDMNKFPCIKIAYDAISKGGNIPCAMNAANEIAVKAFLEEKIGYMDIPKIIEKTIEHTSFISKPEIDEILQTNEEGRNFAQTLLKQTN